MRTTKGREEVRSVKSFLATWRPAGGVIRVVILREADGSWRALLCTDPEASVEAIVQASLDRWAVEQTFHDLKEVEGAEQVQLRRVWSNVGAWNLNLWVHTLVEVWGWGRPVEELSDRTRPPVGRSRASAIARRSSQGVAAGDDRGGISADQPPGAVVGEIPSAGGRTDQDGGMTRVTSGKVQCLRLSTVNR